MDTRKKTRPLPQQRPARGEAAVGAVEAAGAVAAAGAEKVEAELAAVRAEAVVVVAAAEVGELLEVVEEVAGEVKRAEPKKLEAQERNVSSNCKGNIAGKSAQTEQYSFRSWHACSSFSH